MKRIKLHLQAFALFTPAFIGIISTSMLILLFSAIYSAIIVLWWSKTKAGRHFLIRYYREVLRLENTL